MNLKIKGTIITIILICSIFINGCTNNTIIKTEELVDNLTPTEIAEDLYEEDILEEGLPEDGLPEEDIPEKHLSKEDLSEDDLKIVDENNKLQETAAIKNDAETIEFNGALYSIIQVDGGDLSGERKANVAVDIGFGDREYWAFTNEYEQLVYV